MNIKYMLSAIALVGVSSSTQAAFLNIYEGPTQGSTPTVTYGGVSVVLESTKAEYVAGSITFAPIAGDGAGSMNVLYQDAGTGANSDFIHVEWALVSGLIQLQYQFQSNPFTLDSQTIIHSIRTETPGLMFLTPGTPGDNLPGNLTIGIQSDVATAVPEPSTYMAGLAASAMFVGSFFRRNRKQD